MPEVAPRTTDHGDGITAIDTELVRPVFDASHLVVENGAAALVDCGANCSAPHILATLAARDIDPASVEYLFLTHVHLDHAGGAGLLLQSLPNAKAVLHPRGAPHMIDPARLIESAMAVYGEDSYYEQYGDIQPIPESRVIVTDDGQVFSLAGRELRPFYTEGHARHHYCLADPATASVFTGDSFGLSYRELDTDEGEFIYPTTTPIHFDPPKAHEAIDMIMALEPVQLFLTHYSRVTSLARLADDMHHRIDDFVAIARKHEHDDERTAAMHQAMYEYLTDRIRAHGFSGNDDEIHAIVAKDVVLNTMGLEFWLDHH